MGQAPFYVSWSIMTQNKIKYKTKILCENHLINIENIKNLWVLCFWCYVYNFVQIFTSNVPRKIL